MQNPRGALRIQAAASGGVYAGRDRRADEHVPGNGVYARLHAPETARRLREGEQMRQSAEKTPDSPLPDIEKADVLRYNNAVKRLDTTRWRA